MPHHHLAAAALQRIRENLPAALPANTRVTLRHRQKGNEVTWELVLRVPSEAARVAAGAMMLEIIAAAHNVVPIAVVRVCGASEDEYRVQTLLRLYPEETAGMGLRDRQGRAHYWESPW